MPFTTATPADVPGAVNVIVDFAVNNLGWTQGSDSGDVTISPSGKTGMFALRADHYTYNSSNTGSVDYEFLLADARHVPSRQGALVNWLSPLSALYLFGGSAPEPWLLAVFETAPGVHQHLYLGYIEKYGNFTGGAIVDGTIWPWTPTNHNDLEWDSGVTNTVGEAVHLLFQATMDETPYREDATLGISYSGGGVEIVHPDATMDWYAFRAEFSSDEDSAADFPCVGGGWGNAYNGLLTEVPPNSFDGAVPLQPVVVFALEDDGSCRPVGRVPGVRMINMDPFAPRDIVEYANQDYQVFPLCRKADYKDAMDPAAAPGNIQPDGLGNYDIEFGGATEHLALAVLREA